MSTKNEKAKLKFSGLSMTAHFQEFEVDEALDEASKFLHPQWSHLEIHYLMRNISGKVKKLSETIFKMDNHLTMRMELNRTNKSVDFFIWWPPACGYIRIDEFTMDRIKQLQLRPGRSAHDFETMDRRCNDVSGRQLGAE